MRKTAAKKSNKKVYQVWMEESFADEIKALATQHHQTFSEFVRATLVEKAQANYWNHILGGRNLTKKHQKNPLKELANVAA